MKAVSWRAAARASRLGMAALAACVTLGLAACGAKEEKLRFNSLDLTGASYAQSWAMPDASGQMRTLADFAGKVVFVFFGYAQCPDVCPVTMVEMAQVKEQLGQDAKRLQIVFVTVDPERDTPEIMREYLGNFDPDAVPLIGTPEQVAAMAKDFKVTYQKVPGADENSYTINHTAAGYVYDTQGRLRLYVRYGTPVEQIVDDVRQLLKSAPK